MRRLSSSVEQRIEALQNNRYLLGLDEVILTNLTQNARLISYDAGEMIINVIENGDSFNEVPVFDQLENPINVGAVIDWE